MRLATRYSLLVIMSALFTSTDCSNFDQSGDNLIGSWGVEHILFPAVQGQLTIDTRKQPWAISIGGYTAHATSKGDSVSFELGGHVGRFTGFNYHKREIVGHWIQPGTVAPYDQSYASPLTLTEISPDIYRGNVTPLEQSISFYIKIEKNDAGELTGFIRNYEANFYNKRIYDITVNKNKVLFQHPEVPEEAFYDPEKDQLTCNLLNGYPVLVLTRRTDNVLHFFSRSGDKKYEYVKPIPEKDGWTTSSLEDVKIDRGVIERFVQMIIDAKPAIDNPLNIHSVLIARHGKLVLEEYFYGHYKDKPHDMRSASKTIAPILVGIAKEKRYGIDGDTPVYSFFPEYKPFKNWDERKNKITLKDLMNMNSGLAIDDGDPSSPGAEWVTLTQKTTPDVYKYSLDLPLVSEPSGTPVYGSASTNLIGAFLSKSTSQWIPLFFDKYFARPLQIHTYHMNLLPSGEAYMGGGLYMRSRDQLKLGQLFLSKGNWNGQQIIGEDWVKESLISRGIMKPRMEADVNHGYGYAWHFRSQKLGNKETSYYWAGGNGGQLIIVVPELDLVVGFTGGDYTDFQRYLLWEIEYLPKYILPAVK